MQEYELPSDDHENTSRETDAVDSSCVKRVTDTIMGTTLRSEGVDRLRAVVGCFFV